MKTTWNWYFTRTPMEYNTGTFLLGKSMESHRISIENVICFRPHGTPWCIKPRPPFFRIGEIPVQRVVRPGNIKTDGDVGRALNMLVVDVGVCRRVVADGRQAAVARLADDRRDGDRAQRVSRPDVGDVDERLVDEDDGDKHGEALLREASDVADQRAEVERDRRQQKQRHPDADPQTEGQEVDTVLSALTDNQRHALSRFVNRCLVVLMN